MLAPIVLGIYTSKFLYWSTPLLILYLILSSLLIITKIIVHTLHKNKLNEPKFRAYKGFFLGYTQSLYALT